MFASLSKYSPKNLLASSISLSLAQFFQVDPNRVKTNLVQDAKVVLNDIKIKERRLGGGDSYLRVSGSIKQIEFSWVWDGAALIKDVRLKVKGVSIHVSVIQEAGQDAILSDSFSLEKIPLEPVGGEDVAGSKKGANNTDAPSNWKAKYMQQIIDHLTLSVTDVTVTVHLEESQNGEASQLLLLQAKDLELLTFPSEISKEETTALMQRISLASVELWVERDDASRKFPILEPFGYEASVTRISGRRFLDGILSGLFVEGKSICDDSLASSTICLHAGIQQIAGLNSLQQLLLSVGQEDTNGGPGLTGKKSQGTNSSKTTTMNSIFHLPFQAMEVVLENNTNVRLAGCNVQYTTDGSELSLNCSGGIWVENTPLSKDSKWILDLVSCELLLDSLPSQEECDSDSFHSTHSDVEVPTEAENQPDAQPFPLDLSIHTLQKIYCGIQAILPQCNVAKEIAAQTMNQYSRPVSSSSPWSMRSTGPVSFRFTGNSQAWVKVVADSPKLSIALSASKSAISFECKSTKVNSNAGFAIHIPTISTDDDGCLLVEHRIAATVDSVDTFKILQNITNDIVDIIGDESSSSEISPINFSLAGFDVTLEEPQLSTLHLSRIRGSSIDWSIGSLQLHDVGNVTVDASSLQVTLDGHNTTVFVQTIDRLAYNKVDYLAAPIVGTTVAVEKNDVLSVTCKDVYIKCPYQAVSLQSNDDDSQVRSLTFPMLFHLTVEHLRAESIPTGKIDIDGVDFWVRPTSAESLTVDLDLKSINARIKETMELSCGKINSSAKVLTSCRDINDSETMLPGLGQLSLSSVSVHDIVRLSTVVGHLSKPLDVVEITYGGGNVTIKCNKVICCTKSCLAIQSDGAGTKNRYPFAPITVHFEVNRFVAMQEVGPGKPGLCCDGLQIHFTPSETIMGIDATCNYIQGRGLAQAELAAKGVKLNLQKHLLDGKDDLFGLKEMRLTMNEVSTCSIPGMAKLAKPICDPVIQFKNNLFDVKCDFIHVSYIQSEEISINTEGDQMAAEFADIPVSFHIAVNQMIIDNLTTKVVCNEFSTQYMKASTKSSKSLQVGIMSVNGKFGMDILKLDGIKVSTKWHDAVERGQEITVPYLGSLLFAQAELEACTEMTTSTFCLIEPLYKPKLLFQDGFLILELTKLQLNVTSTVAGSDSPVGRQNKMLDLVGIQVPTSFNVSNKLRLKTPAFDIQLENVGIDFVPSLTSPQGDVFIHCDRLEESKLLMSAKKLSFRSHLLFGEPQKRPEIRSNVFPGMGCVENASIQIDEITSFFVEGKGQLSRPLQNTIISYQDGTFSTEIETLKFECQSLALGLKKLTLRIQSDPSDNTIRFITQSNEITGNGGVSFSAAGVGLITAVVLATTTNKEVLDSKPVVIPQLGYASSIVLDVSEVTSLSIQNVGQLKHPITKLALRFEKDIITSRCPTVFLQRFAPKKKPSQSKLYGDGPPFELPCKASISIGAFQVHDTAHGKAAHREIQCRSLDLTLEPLKARSGQPKESIRGLGIGIQVICSDFKSTEGSTIIDVPRLSVSGLLQLNDIARIGNLAIGIEKAQLAAQFSSPRWSESTENEHSSVIAFPFASIPKFELTLRYVGTFVNVNDATIGCDEFQGNANTTSSQIEKHYTNIVKRRIPFLLSNADIANCNVGDSIGVIGGKVLTKTSVLGATVGIASRDAVGSAVTMGKLSRGASSSDSYRFGDFSRGVAASVKHASKSGAEIRGDDSYQVGDFTAGTTRAAGNYASENRGRLAGASGSAIGMGIGAALLGPVGFIAGSMIGGSAAKSSMAALTGPDEKKDTQRLEESHYSENRSHSTTQHQSGGQVPDFLSSVNTHHVTRGASQQQYANQGPAQSLQQNRQSAGVFQRHAHHPHSQANTRTTPSAEYQDHNVDNQQQGYQFGDITRGIIARGKKADGRNDKSGYKFGDITRGFFG